MQSSSSSVPGDAYPSDGGGTDEGCAFHDANSSIPVVKLLSNGRYHLMVSAAGGGYSRCGENALTRWREDATRDSWGAFVYVRDRENGDFWANTRQPVFNPAADYRANFSGPHAVMHSDTPEISIPTRSEEKTDQLQSLIQLS